MSTNPQPAARETAAHTPTIPVHQPDFYTGNAMPWSVAHHGFEDDTPMYAVVRGSFTLADRLTAERAAFIVEAVNAHAGLVAENARLRAALEGLLPVVSEMVKTRVFQTQRAKTEASLTRINLELRRLYDLTNAARTALASAGGGK